MNPQAIHQAQQRLARASQALETLGAATSYDEAETAWSDFLLACSTVYSKLEQGAKGVGASEAWFGRQKHIRKKHPVLRYLHFARNSDEHGIERVTERHPDSNWMGKPKAFWEREELTLQFLDQSTMKPTGQTGKGWAHGPHLKLVRAVDNRFNDHADPPQFDDEFPCHPIILAEKPFHY
jgi:hypothetical protein